METDILIVLSIIIVILVIRKLREKNGLYETHHSNGNLRSSDEWKKGKQVGMTKLFHENGKIQLENSFNENGIIEWSKSYYENGQIQNHGNYKYTESGVYSRKDGVWKYYYDNGQIQSESIIKDGVEELKFYDKEGNLLPEGEGC